MYSATLLLFRSSPHFEITQQLMYDELEFNQVRRARPVASVNRGFEQQLRAYGATQCDVFAAHQMMLRIKAANMYDRRVLVLQRNANKAAGGRNRGRDAGLSTTAGEGEGEGEGADARQQQELPPSTPPHQLTSSAVSAGSISVGSTAAGDTPSAPRSPRGKGRAGESPGDGGSSSVSSILWQRKGRGAIGGGGGGSTNSVTSIGSISSAASSMLSAVGGSVGAGGLKARDELHFLAKEVCFCQRWGRGGGGRGRKTMA